MITILSDMSVVQGRFNDCDYLNQDTVWSATYTLGRNNGQWQIVCRRIEWQSFHVIAAGDLWEMVDLFDELMGR